MTAGRGTHHRAWSFAWLVLGCAAGGCSSTNVTPASEDGGAGDSSAMMCEDLSGTWDVAACGLDGQCTIAQAGCALSVVCMAFLLGQGTASGTIDTDDFTFTTDEGACTGTVSGTVFVGTCTDTAGSPCAMTGNRV